MGMKIRIVINLTGMEYISRIAMRRVWKKTAVSGQIRAEFMNDVSSISAFQSINQKDKAPKCKLKNNN